MDHNSSWGWVIGIWVFVIFLWFSVGDFKLNLPSSLPNKIESEVISPEVKKFFIIYNEDFSGVAILNKERMQVEFIVANKSEDPVWLNDARVFLWEKKKGYGLIKQEFVSSNLNGAAEWILNPGEEAKLICALPQSTPDASAVKGFSITSVFLKEKIRFGYHKLGWWDRLRWFIAEQIRQNA